MCKLIMKTTIRTSYMLIKPEFYFNKTVHRSCIDSKKALKISLFTGANSSLTAAAVVLTGLVGANFVEATLD